MTQITQLGYIGLEVSNLAKWDQFAADVLGLCFAPGPQPGTRRLRMDDHQSRIILTEGPADDIAFAGWQCADSAAVEAFARHLDSEGVQWTLATKDELALRSVQKMLHFSDTVGTRHEVFCGPQLAAEAFVSPKVKSGFVTGSEGMGHVVFGSEDYGKTIDFAKRILGLTISDTVNLSFGPGINFEVSFFHANPRHHSMAVAPNPPMPGPHKRLHHFMIEVQSVEQVGFARDRCLNMGQAVQMDIGQHPNDKMISFYGQTPSGFLVEVGWGGVKIDDATWTGESYDRVSDWGHRPSAENSATPAMA
jgi:biphenyl-2,3-diol 1,2-dioxygenase